MKYGKSVMYELGFSYEDFNFWLYDILFEFFLEEVYVCFY